MIYDAEANIMCIELAKGNIEYAKQFGNFIVHFSRHKKPILLEILEASNFKGQFDNITNLKDIKKILPVN